MTTSSVLASAWAVLEGEPDCLSGVYERRVFAHSAFTVYAGIVRPELNLQFSIIVPSSVGTDGLERETPGFRVHRHYIAQSRQTKVVLELCNTTFRELFEVVAEDVARSVLASADEVTAISAMRNRLNHWERFMRTSGLDGLSREDQIGLFGELLLLKTMIDLSVPAATAVSAWKGPDGANQDYQLGDRALEVKATVGNAASLVFVSNELQLDETDCGRLFLAHFWLRQLDGSGQTLPQLVSEIGAMLDTSVAQEFADRLIKVGYHEVHRPLYETKGYTERGRLYFAIEGDFPRIRRADLRPGVRAVEYRIELAGFEAFQRSQSEVMKIFTGDSP